MNFVFVHGIQQGKESSAKLQEIWLGALRPRTISSVSVPFYGRKLDNFVNGHRGPSSQVDFNAFAAEFGADATGAPVAEIQNLQNEVKDSKKHRDIQNLWVVLAFARISEEAMPKFADRFITRWLKEVHTYLCNEEAKAVVDGIVESEIVKMCEKGPTVVVGHSLGSVVAYNILRAKEFKNVRHFVTLGSPLGISAVARRLPTYADDHPLSLGEWFNGFDRRDIVALNPLDQASLGSTCAIENVDNLKNSTDNRHGIIGYLEIDSVASYLVEKLGTLR
jgi:hypothetical protein